MAGVREAKKEDKRRRIHAAASALFRAHGYEATTTRAIAAAAGIATGTLFLYVRDKDEALALVYGDDVDVALARGTSSRARRPHLGFVAGVVARLRPLYALYARHPELALRYLRRIPTLDGGEGTRAEYRAHASRNARFAGVLAEELGRAVARGELRSDLDVALATRTLFGIVRILVFQWLAGDGAARPARPTLPAGLRDLEATLGFLVAGMRPARGA